jgi:integrase
VDIMLASGLRIGEACAITWPAVDIERGTVEVRGTVIRVTGEGLRIKPKPKSRAGWRVIELPSWGIDILKRRKVETLVNDWEAVFTSRTGRLRDRSNTNADLKNTLARIGYAPHHFAHVPADGLRR